MYLSPEIFEWAYDAGQRSGPLETEYLYRGHEIWRHAKKQLDVSPTDLHRVDCISSLRRAINHRLKSLTAAYRIDLLPSPRAKRQVLEKLQDYGLVRPALIKYLLEVRNLIEHEDASPPDLAKCHYFIDIVWYFLKSTDELVNMAVDCLVYEEDEKSSKAYLWIEPTKEWTVRLDGELRGELVLKDSEPGALELTDVVSRKTRGRPGYLNIKAKVVTTDENLLKLAREYFGAAGYWYDDA